VIGDPWIGNVWNTPLPPMFLEQYDSKEFSGWGSAKDMTGKDLGE